MFNFKKVSAMIVSVLLIGMTMGVAAAADYPAPFVVGSAANVLIVHGSGAGMDALDITKAEDIRDDLSSEIGTNGTKTISGESYLFESGTNKLNIGDNLTVIKTVSIKKGDLPTVLADGTYSNAENTDFDYEQKIDPSADLEYAHFQDTEYKSKAPTLGLRIPKNELVFNYTLDFVKSAEDDGGTEDWTDFEDTEIKILGKTFSIVDAKNSTRSELTLMSGSEMDTLNLYESKAYIIDGTTYNVELSYVDSSEYCRFTVDGVPTDKILKGGVDKLADGTYIGVSDVDYSTGAVTEIMRCKFFLGADKIVLDDTKEVTINDVAVSKLKAYIDETYPSGGGTPVKLDKIILEWKANDDLFVTVDSEISMPGFDSVKISSGGIVAPEPEKISIRGSSTEEVVLTVPIKSGTVDISLLGANGTSGFDVIGGADNGEGLMTNNVTGYIAASASFLYDLGDNATGDQYFVATYHSGASGSSYLVEISDSDDTNGVDFKDVVTKTMLAENIKNATSFTIGDASITLNEFVEDSYVNMTPASGTYFDRIITNKGLVIWLPIANQTVDTSPVVNLTNANVAVPNANSYIIFMQEEDKDGNLGTGVGSAAGADINVTVQFTSTHKVETKIGDTEDNVLSGRGSDTGDLEDPNNDNFFIGYVHSDLGSRTEYDSDPDEDTVDIYYYGEQIYGKVYISEADAVLSGDAGALGSAVIRDSELSSSTTKNLIVVGGSCINSAAATLVGGSYCSESFTDATGIGAGQFIIKGYTTNSLTSGLALLVAGYDVGDTVNAATYLVNEEVDTSKEYKGTSATSATMVVA